MPRKGAKNSTLPRTYAAITRIAAGKKILHTRAAMRQIFYFCCPKILSDSAITSAEYFFLRLFKMARYIK